MIQELLVGEEVLFFFLFVLLVVFVVVSVLVILLVVVVTRGVLLLDTVVGSFLDVVPFLLVVVGRVEEGVFSVVVNGDFVDGGEGTAAVEAGAAVLATVAAACFVVAAESA